MRDHLGQAAGLVPRRDQDDRVGAGVDAAGVAGVESQPHARPVADSAARAARTRARATGLPCRAERTGRRGRASAGSPGAAMSKPFSLTRRETTPRSGIRASASEARPPAGARSCCARLRDERRGVEASRSESGSVAGSQDSVSMPFRMPASRSARARRTPSRPWPPSRRQDLARVRRADRREPVGAEDAERP